MNVLSKEPVAAQWKVTILAAPKSARQAPLPVRVGVIEKLVEWR